MPQQLNHGHTRSGGHAPPERRPPFLVPALAVVLVALLSGSAAHVAAPERTRVVPPFHRMMYLPDEQDRRIARAKDALVVDCTAARGLSYTPDVVDVTEDEALAALRPFGLESPEVTEAEPLPPRARPRRALRARLVRGPGPAHGGARRTAGDVVARDRLPGRRGTPPAR
ncbi:hypothetical protein [Saccharothrix lopnurensis]|uniref:Uncharacterized protein n=1 Tax=Saccharothrix lopnurensis TaxID=1670621 RepID=A0ABW1P0C7_9PSEU